MSEESSTHGAAWDKKNAELQNIVEDDVLKPIWPEPTREDSIQTLDQLQKAVALANAELDRAIQALVEGTELRAG